MFDGQLSVREEDGGPLGFVCVQLWIEHSGRMFNVFHPDDPIA